MPKDKGEPFIATPLPDPPIAPEDLALRLGYAALLGIAVAAVYFLTQRRRRSEAASFVSTLVLLTILLAMVGMVIGSDIARAFSLVGALSIVRFRTVVDDTRDTAFVIFAVIAGMAAGAGAYMVPAVGVPVVAIVAWGLAEWGRMGGANGKKSTTTGTASKLVIRLGSGLDPDVVLAGVFVECATQTKLVSAQSAKQGTFLDLTYAVRVKPEINPVTMIAALTKIEGVQNVEWKEAKDDKDDD